MPADIYRPEQFQEGYERLLRRTGGGGDDGKMEALEKRVGVLEADLKTLMKDVAEIKGKISQLPTVWQLVLANFGLALTLSAFVFAIARAMR